MRAFDPLKPLIFIHVPKTAGSAVKLIVQDWFPNRLHRHYYNEATGEMPKVLPITAPKFVNAPPVIYGHFNRLRGFGVEDYYPDVSQFVTILRDPFEVAVSNYFYLKSTAETWKDQSRIPTGNLEDYIKTTNLNILNHFPREMTHDNYKDVIEEYFIEVGITEELPKSLELIAKKLGKPFVPSDLERVNVTKRDQPLPEKYRDQFYDTHRLEHDVYEYAKSRIALQKNTGFKGTLQTVLSAAAKRLRFSARARSC